MKKIISSLTIVALLFGVMQFTSCKPKDSDISNAITKALSAENMEGVSANVKEGVVTLTGECKDDAAKAACEALVAKVKGVKSVVNECAVKTVPAAEEVVTATASALEAGLKDAFKDVKGVTASVVDGKIKLVGEMAKTKWAMLKPILDKLKPAGYDLSELKTK